MLHRQRGLVAWHVGTSPGHISGEVQSTQAGVLTIGLALRRSIISSAFVTLMGWHYLLGRCFYSYSKRNLFTLNWEAWEALAGRASESHAPLGSIPPVASNVLGIIVYFGLYIHHLALLPRSCLPHWTCSPHFATDGFVLPVTAIWS